MLKQKGQSAVELAIILPTFFTFIFAIIYTGIMFMDYIQFSNAARSVARDIALEKNPTARSEIIKEIKGEIVKDKKYLDRYVNPITTLYNTKFDANPINDEKDIEVTVSFERNDENFPLLLDELNFPPKNLNPIKYTMPLEKSEG